MRGILKTLKDANVSVPQAHVLFAVSEYPGRSMREYAELTDNVLSSMSRHLLDMGEINRFHQPGLGLVEQWPNPQDRRSNVYRLTPKGMDLVGRIMGMLAR